jgi:UDP-N-acetylmuramoyl-L-alanyl-D-glutamate--2,6-diaminopimelate ligase
MKKLKDLLKEIPYSLVKGSLDTDVSDIIYDSRKVKENCAFLCISGTTVDAHTFIPDAVQKGASVVIIEKEVPVDADVTVIKVDSARKALAYLAAAYFDYPAKKLTTIGLTGTKGKTTTTYMLEAILKHAGKKAGVIGTIGALIDGTKYPTNNTTPESYEVQYLMSEMVKAGCEYMVMEVSSQGLMMNRVDGFTFDYGVFTNLSPDHIGPNEHKDLDEYIYYKSLLFQRCNVGFFNADDSHLDAILKGHTCEVKTFGFAADADLRASNDHLFNEHGHLGIKFDLNGDINTEMVVNIPGKFSVYNALVALSISHALGIPIEDMKQALKVIHVKGRVEIVPISKDFTILIDYAHNAMSMESILETLREYQPHRLISLFGCGGNRSKLRRYEMGETSGRMADLSIITADNNRYEDIKDILADIKIGLGKTDGRFIEIEDRTDAIHYAIDHAQKGDIIALLGKGHEEYIDVKGVKSHYSEREIIEAYAKEKHMI